MSQTYLPTALRRDLWIRAAARCQFRGCNNPIDKNFLTQQRVVLGEYCHIVGDSPQGPRGDNERSPELAVDPRNLILCCSICHKTIDDAKLEESYPEALLVEMKQEHELHIQRLYDARDVKRSMPLLITGRIAGTPTSISIDQARYAVLHKTGYRRFPAHSERVISLNETGFTEEESTYWSLAKRAIGNRFSELLTAIRDIDIEHIDVFALAQIPVLMYAGYCLSDRVPATVHQAFRDQDNKWLWPASSEQDAVFSYTLPNESQLGELALMVSLSGEVRMEDVSLAVPGVPVGTLEATIKSPFVISKETDLASFVQTWRALLAEIHTRFGHVKLHIFPAVPNSAAFEMGRSVHPKVLPNMTVWDFVNGIFKPAIEYGV